MKSNWLRDFREYLDLSQEELVARLQIEGFDVSRAMLSHWETGRNPPPLEKPEFRLALSRALRVSIPEILAAAGYELSEEKHSKEARRAAYIVDQLPDEYQDLAIKLLESVLEKARAG